MHSLKRTVVISVPVLRQYKKDQFYLSIVFNLLLFKYFLQWLATNQQSMQAPFIQRYFGWFHFRIVLKKTTYNQQLWKFLTLTKDMLGYSNSVWTISIYLQICVALVLLVCGDVMLPLGLPCSLIWLLHFSLGPGRRQLWLFVQFLWKSDRS